MKIKKIVIICLKAFPCRAWARMGLAALLVAGMWACNELDNDYSANPNLRLGFSTDTLAFDTVFTTVGSATRELMIYNRNSSALLIKSIRLANSNPAGFRINVDGRSGNSFSDIRIAGNDSLFVFVEVTANPVGEDFPALVEDKLEFVVNNAPQYVVLQAYGQDVRLLKGGYFVKQDTLWTAERPYLIYDSIVVDSGATLRIEPGAVFYMHDKAKWIINGTLAAVGTLDKPVLFRGDRLENLLIDLPFDHIPGLWDGLYFGSGSFGNELDYVVLRNGHKGIACAESTPAQSKLRISNTQVTNMKQSVMEAVNCRIEAVNSEFSNSSGPVVSLTGGDARFIHCTLVNFYIFTPGRQGYPALCLANYSVDEKGAKTGFPLLRASFGNCIIDGSLSEGSKPLGGELQTERMEGFEFNFSFNHCAVKTMETPDTCFAAVQFITSKFFPLYKQTGESANGYAYDLRPEAGKDKDGKLLDKQPVVGQADTTISALYPYDRFGISRMESVDGPDIGAYEYVPEEEKP